jgi:hypothetical protein
MPLVRSWLQVRFFQGSIFVKPCRALGTGSYPHLTLPRKGGRGEHTDPSHLFLPGLVGENHARTQRHLGGGRVPSAHLIDPRGRSKAMPACSAWSTRRATW